MASRVVMLLSNDFVSDPRVEKEAAALVSAGYEVTVLAWNRSGVAPAEEERSGIRIIRVGPNAPHGGGPKNLSRYRAFWRACASRAAALGPDVVHCHDADTIPAGRRAIRELRRQASDPKLVVDFHELYRDSKMVPQRGLVGAIARGFVRRIERAGVREASAVIVANPGTVGYYSALGDGAPGDATSGDAMSGDAMSGDAMSGDAMSGDAALGDRIAGADALSAGKVVVVPNAPDAERFRPHEHGLRAEREGAGDARGPGGDFRVCYIGQKRYLGNLEILMDAVQGLEGVRAYLGGGGVDAEAVERLAAARGQIETEGRLSYDEIPSRYETCDAVYAVNDVRVGNMRVNFPVKSMEGMACGLPVLVNQDTWVGEYVTSHGVGLTVDGTDVQAVKGAIVRLRDDPELARRMGERGRAIVESGLNWKAAAERLVGVYESLEGNGAR